MIPSPLTLSRAQHEAHAALAGFDDLYLTCETLRDAGRRARRERTTPRSGRENTTRSGRENTTRSGRESTTRSDGSLYFDHARIYEREMRARVKAARKLSASASAGGGA